MTTAVGIHAVDLDAQSSSKFGVSTIGGDVVDVFCSGSPCNGTAGRNHSRATSKSVYEHPLSGLVKYVQKWHRILKKAQRGSPYVTVLENVEAGVPIPQ